MATPGLTYEPADPRDIVLAASLAAYRVSAPAYERTRAALTIFQGKIPMCGPFTFASSPEATSKAPKVKDLSISGV